MKDHGKMKNTSESAQQFFLKDIGYSVLPGDYTPMIPLSDCHNLLKLGCWHPCKLTEEKLKFDFSNYYEVENSLKGKRCFLIGGGSSLNDFDYSKLDNDFTICVNHSIMKYPKAKALLYIDFDFLRRRKQFVKNYKGMIFTAYRTGTHQFLNKRDNVYIFPFNNVEPQTQLNKGLYNSLLSGMCALNLALIMGANKIYLLGYDMKDIKGKTRLDIDFNMPLGKYGHDEWVQRRIKMFNKFAKYKNRVVNCSMESALAIFEKQPIEAVL